MKRRLIILGACLVAVASLAANYGGGWLNVRSCQRTALVKEAEAADNNMTNDRYFYAPGTEAIGANEMRVTALGTGMPNARKSQAASCWLVELGNGDKFFFDLGSGSMHNFSALNIPYGDVTKVFISHLHNDHFGDFGAYWMGGWVAGRLVGIDIWGPSGEIPELGTKYAIETWMKALNWDLTSRTGRLPAPGSEIRVHEFDYRGENKVIYEENGVRIRSFPAIHAIDGCVSFILEWNGLKFVFSGDTTPNKWMLKYGKDADILIHECFFTIGDLQEKFGWSLAAAVNVNLFVHTAPPAFAKILAEVKPRMGVAYHFFNDFDTGPAVMEEVRKVYEGPVTFAKDMMVWNITPEKIRVREVVAPHDCWPAKETKGGDPNKAPRGKLTHMSDYVKSGAQFFPGIISPEDACKKWPGIQIPGVECK